MSVSVGILIVGIEKYLQIHTDTSNTYNTFIYCYTYIYLRYPQIHTIPSYSDIPTHTCDTHAYRQYL